MEDTTGARSVNANSLLSLVLEIGGCWLPPDDAGAFSTKVWARILGGKSERTVQDWIKVWSIPATLAGDTQMVEARDMRRFLPRINAAGEPTGTPKKRKG